MTDASERSAPGGEGRWHALREALAWLAHPVSLAAIAVLALNDHVLKDAYGNWWTGKLSDFAGLVFFPALLAVAFAALAPRAPFRHLALASVATTGLGFAWVKATEIGATTASAAWSVVAGPSVILRDPTDLTALPMLALAAAIALRAKPRPRTVLTAIALPFAVLATAATSAPLNPSATVLADRPGGPMLVVERGGFYGYDPVYQRQTNGTWVEVSTMGDSDINAEDYSTTRLACVRADRDVCYRPLDGGIGVERSTDAGETWHVDWALTDAELAVLRDVYDLRADRYGAASTHGVAVVDHSDGYEVIAANGFDGIAVRDRSGTWTRTGWQGLDCCASVSVADLKVVHQPWRAHEALAWPVTWAMVAFVLAFGLVLVASPRGSRLGVGPAIMGGVLVIGGLGWSALALWINSSPAGRVPYEDFDALMVGGNLVLGLGLAFMGMFLLRVGRGRSYLIALAGAAGVAVLVGVGSSLAGGAARAEALVAATAFILGVGSLLWFEWRRFRSRRDRDPSTRGVRASP